jgi:hypothetical protein
MYAFSHTSALFVFKLYVLVDRFSTDEYLIFAFFHKNISTNHAWIEDLSYFGAEHHSI